MGITRAPECVEVTHANDTENDTVFDSIKKYIRIKRALSEALRPHRMDLVDLPAEFRLPMIADIRRLTPALACKGELERTATYMVDAFFETAKVNPEVAATIPFWSTDYRNKAYLNDDDSGP